jgi:hypothetical protein
MKTPRKLLMALLAGALALAGCASGDDASAEAPAGQQNQAEGDAENAQADGTDEPNMISGEPAEKYCGDLEQRLDQVNNNWGAALALQHREMLPGAFNDESVQRMINNRDALIDECLPEEGQQWWSGDVRDRIDDTVNGIVEHDLLYGSEYLLALTYIGHPHYSLFTDEERAEAGFELNQEELERFISMDNQQDVHQAAVDLVRADRGERYLLHPWNPAAEDTPTDEITGTGDYDDVCAPETFINGPPESEWIVEDFDTEIMSYMKDNWEPVYEEACQFTLYQ